jgi:hypothetical protein
MELRCRKSQALEARSAHSKKYALAAMSPHYTACCRRKDEMAYYLFTLNSIKFGLQRAAQNHAKRPSPSSDIFSFGFL